MYADCQHVQDWVRPGAGALSTLLLLRSWLAVQMKTKVRACVISCISLNPYCSAAPDRSHPPFQSSLILW